MPFTELFRVQLSESDESCKFLKVSLFKDNGKPDTHYVDIRNYKKIDSSYYATPEGVCYTSDEFLQLIEPIVKHKDSTYTSNGRIASIFAGSLLGFRLKKRTGNYELDVSNPERRVILANLEAIKSILQDKNKDKATQTAPIFFATGPIDPSISGSKKVEPNIESFNTYGARIKMEQLEKRLTTPTNSLNSLSTMGSEERFDEVDYPYPKL